jgi:molybdopterin biosynthesis enzyme MoaB
LDTFKISVYLHKIGNAVFANYVPHLAVSDSCSQGKAEDKSGPNLAAIITKGIIPNGEVVLQDCVPDEQDCIKVI